MQLPEKNALYSKHLHKPETVGTMLELIQRNMNVSNPFIFVCVCPSIVPKYRFCEGASSVYHRFLYSHLRAKCLPTWLRTNKVDWLVGRCKIENYKK